MCLLLAYLKISNIVKINYWLKQHNLIRNNVGFQNKMIVFLLYNVERNSIMLKEESKIKALCQPILSMSKKIKNHRKIPKNKRRLQLYPRNYKNKIRKAPSKQISKLTKINRKIKKLFKVKLKLKKLIKRKNQSNQIQN